MDDLLSIIIPAYNIESYIGRCLESLIIQTYKNLEIIVVDDGSKDNTLSIIKEYCSKDNRIKVIHKKNEGVSVARLTGMKKANGEYIGFVDGDDIVEKDMFEFLMNNAKKYGADISHCGYVMDFPDGHSDYYYNTGKRIAQNNFNGLEDLLEGKFVEPGLCNKIYKKTLIEIYIRQNSMDYSIKNLEDLLVNYYLFKEAKLSIYEDQCKYHYMLRKESAATSLLNENKLKDPLKVLKILLNETRDNQILSDIIYERYIYQIINVATLGLNKQKNLIYPYRKQIRKELRKEIFLILKSRCSLKIKIFSLWCFILPSSYRCIHFLYSKIKKSDNKYQV